MKKLRIENILVPLDFSNLTGPGIATAQALARKFDAAIHLVYVHPFYYPSGFMPPGAPLPLPVATYEDEAIAQESGCLRLLAKQHAVPEANCHFLTGGPVFDRICGLAQELPADLIVMLTHGRAGLDRLLEGSTAERVVQHSPCPVLVAGAAGKKSKRPATHGEIDRILVPVDFSQSSFHALEYAIEFAERAAARLIVFHAVQFGWAFADGEPGVYEVAPLRESARQEAEAQMESFVRSAKFRAVSYETLIHIGSPVGEICAFAEAREVDLIITATHGRTGFTHLVMGSVAEQVVRHADRPVLVVPSHPEVRRATSIRPARSGNKQPRAQGSRTPSPRLAKKNLKLGAHPSPERRKANKFRESHGV